MKSLLLALGLALVCHTQAIAIPQTMADMDILKLTGEWNAVAMAASDASAESPFLGTYVKALRLTDSGNLEIVLISRENGRCTEKTIITERTASPSEFNYLGQYKAFLLNVHQDNQALICVENTASSQPNLVCQYLARTLKAQDKAMEQFHAALQMLQVPMQVFQDFSQVEDQCHV